MISGPGAIILAAPNTQADGHPPRSALVIPGQLGPYHAQLHGRRHKRCMLDDVAVQLDPELRHHCIADLNAASGSFPNQCMNYYAIDMLGTILNDTMNYTEINSGYNAVIGDYQSYILELIPEMIQDFMAPSTAFTLQGRPGNQFFDCTCEGYAAMSIYMATAWGCRGVHNDLYANQLDWLLQYHLVNVRHQFLLGHVWRPN